MRALVRSFLIVGLPVILLACGNEVTDIPDGYFTCSQPEDCQPGYDCQGGSCVPEQACNGIDVDQDGYCDAREGGDDCNDNRADIHPDAPEACDGLDNNCDGQIDEDCPCETGASQRCGSDVGICRPGTQVCADGHWGECTGGREPDDQESCEDDVDNDCNGAINDGCPCNEGDTRECGSAIGECTQGAQACVEEADTWVWGPCLGGTPAIYEICGDGLDNDCDGGFDEGCPCQGESRTCGSSLGVCREGTQHCVGGVWQACQDARLPDDEICDGLDNDCDAMTDEDCDCLDGTFQSCGIDVGQCRMGTRQCVRGHWGLCEGNQPPEPELCDGRDNDCDMSIDEDFDLGQACFSGIGVCARPGIRVCTVDLTGTRCNAIPGEGEQEACDGLDNDCDGETDEGFDGVGEPCELGLGQCRASGVTVCGAFGGVACNAKTAMPVNESCDGLDNDCDGFTDENFALLGLPCNDGLGACYVQGSYECTPDGSGTLCNVEAGVGSPESCNSIDDDCDGQTDEDWTEACSTQCGQGHRFCVNGQPGPCLGAEPEDEICDYLDNDCDGQTDEGYTDLGKECQAGQGACLSLGYYVCDPATGNLICNAIPGTPQDEACYDGIDNDCDTKVDINDDDCSGSSCRDVDPSNLKALQGVAGGLGLMIFRRRRRRKNANRAGGVK